MNFQSKLSTISLSILFTALAQSPAWAAAPAKAARLAGPANGGGGSQIQTAFRTRGASVISKINSNWAANTYCDATTLQSALDAANVRIVDHLIDPRTHLPPTEQGLDAFTVPGDIQLLQPMWQQMISPNVETFRDGKSVTALILHEIYRATGTCDDNRNKSTEAVMQILEGQIPVGAAPSIAPFLETFNLAYVYSADDYYATSSFGSRGLAFRQYDPQDAAASAILVCDRPIAIGGQVTCFQKGIDYSELFKNVSVVVTSNCPNSSIGCVDTNSLGAAQYERIQAGEPFGLRDEDYANQLNFVSNQHPLFIKHDLREGQWFAEIH